MERPEKIDEIIYPEIASFLMLIKDQDRVSPLLLLINTQKKKNAVMWLLMGLPYSCLLVILMQHVRRAAVLALSTFAHNKPNLIKGLLPELLPLLYDQTIVKVTKIFALCWLCC